MALYLGSHRVKLMLGGILYHINSNTIIPPIVNRDSLISSDNYLLKDANGLYLLPKVEINPATLVTLDNYLLKDINELYLIAKES